MREKGPCDEISEHQLRCAMLAEPNRWLMCPSCLWLVEKWNLQLRVWIKTLGKREKRENLWWEHGNRSACSSRRRGRIQDHLGPRPRSSMCELSASASSTTTTDRRTEDWRRGKRDFRLDRDGGNVGRIHQCSSAAPIISFSSSHFFSPLIR